MRAHFIVVDCCNMLSVCIVERCHLSTIQRDSGAFTGFYVDYMKEGLGGTFCEEWLK
jgi:hypothetical protein